MADTKVDILIQAEDQASSVIKNIEGNVNSFASKLKENEATFKGLAAVGTAAFGAISYAVYESVKAAQESAQVQAQLGAVLKSTGGAAGVTADMALKLSKELQRTSTVGDEAVLAGENMLLTFTNIGKDAFPKTSQAVLDMAYAMNGGLKPSLEQIKGQAILVGKALQDPDAGLGALHRVGVNVEELKKKFTDNMSIMEKQKLILQELGTEFGGSAAAQLNTFGGKMDNLKERINDVQEGIGNAFIPILTKLVEKISPVVDKIVAWVEKHPKLVAGIMATVAAVGLLTAAIGFIALAMITLETVSWPIIGTVALIEIGIFALIAVGYLLYTHWSELKNLAIEVWTAIKEWIMTAMENVGEFIMGVWNGIKDFFTTVWNGIVAVFQFAVSFAVGLVLTIFSAMGIDLVAVFESIKMTLSIWWDAVVGFFTTSMEVISGIWHASWQAISDFITPIWEGIKGVITAGWTWLVTKFKEYSDPITKAWSTLWAGLTSAVGTAWDVVKNVVKDSINWMIDGINKLIESLNNVAKKGAGVIGLTAPQIPTVPRLAQGGIVTSPTLAMIGEGGESEAVIPLSKMNQFGGGNITVNVYGGNYLSENAAQMFGDSLINQLKLQLRV